MLAAVLLLVQGRSSNEDLARLALALRAQGYWAYVQSKSNWSDDISRFGFDGPWFPVVAHEPFYFHSAVLPPILFLFPFSAVIRLFEFQ